MKIKGDFRYVVNDEFATMTVKIMIVCHGNICRSPMAEFIFKDLAKKQGVANRFLVASSATSTEEIWNGIGNPVYSPAKAELERHGLSCGGKRAVQLQKSDYDKYDLFIGMDSTNIRNMLRIFGGAGAYTFLGTANYVKHDGSRPMNITWKLYRPIPAKFLKKTNKLIG